MGHHMLSFITKLQSAKWHVGPFRLACVLAVMTCCVALANPAMAASKPRYSRPATPVLSTSPGGSCATAGPAVVGNGSVTLQAAVSDSDSAPGNTLTLGVAFIAFANGDRADTFTSPARTVVDAASGTTAELVVSQADLQSAASQYGSGGEVSITWTARAVVESSTGHPASPSSHLASCTFTFDDATPSTPDLWADSGYTTACDSLSGATIGEPVTVYATSPDSTTATIPSSYIYQLNGGNSETATAGSASPYAAALSVTPASASNVLTVTAVGPGGNLSDAATCDFAAVEPGPEADQDLTGDNIPDLLTVGNAASGVAPGLWLAAGEGSDGTFNGTVNTAATDIAPAGPQGVGTPSSWTGMQAIIGQFLGSGDNAVQAYDPSTGVAYLLPGDANGTVSTSQETNLTGTFAFLPYIDASGDTNANPDYPLQLVDAYNVSGDDEPTPDEMGTFTDPTLGSFLAYFASDGGPGLFDAAIGGAPYILSNATPDGTMDWNDWTVTTAAAPPGAETASGSPVLADMYLWNSQTGSLYLWELTGLTNEVAGGLNSNFEFANASATLSYTQITVDPGTPTDSGWNTGSTLNTLQATQIDGGTGLIDVTSAGQVQSWTVDIDDSTATAVIAQANATGSSQLLQTSS
jgi:hypothetical protein